MDTPSTAVAESSPAAVETFEIPSDAQANLEWRKSGELPAAKAAQPKGDSTPSKTASADDESAETAAASAPAKQQEKTKQPTAADRLNELLADLKKSGLTPAELKTFKREAQAAASPASTPEKTANPQEPAAPVKPKQLDFDTWEKYDEAKDEYTEKLAEFKANAAVAKDRAQRAAEAQQLVLKQKLSDAKARYGEATESTINIAVNTIVNDAAVSPVVKALMDESPVLMDVLFVLGSKTEDLASFVDLAKTNPGAAVRKFALLENLVEAELKKGSAKDTETGERETERDESGRFAKPPAKQKPTAPPPTEELSTRRSAPPDAIDAALRNDDFSAFKAEEDRRDLARRRGA